MFFFNKKKLNYTKQEDIVWYSRAKKYKGLFDFIEQKDTKQLYIIVSFFESSHQELIEIWKHTGKPYEASWTPYEQKVKIVLHSQLSEKDFENYLKQYSEKGYTVNIIFTEHYPLYSKESQVLEHINQVSTGDVSITFYASLDDALMTLFGAERIRSLLKSMGMKEEESISHKMVSSAIKNAQEKLDKNVKVEVKAFSQEEWFQKNHIEK
jgi:hypothetical protein